MTGLPEHVVDQRPRKPFVAFTVYLDGLVQHRRGEVFQRNPGGASLGLNALRCSSGHVYDGVQSAPPGVDDPVALAFRGVVPVGINALDLAIETVE